MSGIPGRPGPLPERLRNRCGPPPPAGGRAVTGRVRWLAWADGTAHAVPPRVLPARAACGLRTPDERLCRPERSRCARCLSALGMLPLGDAAPADELAEARAGAVLAAAALAGREGLALPDPAAWLRRAMADAWALGAASAGRDAAAPAGGTTTHRERARGERAREGERPWHRGR